MTRFAINDPTNYATPRVGVPDPSLNLPTMQVPRYADDGVADALQSVAQGAQNLAGSIHQVEQAKKRAANDVWLTNFETDSMMASQKAIDAALAPDADPYTAQNTYQESMQSMAERVELIPDDGLKARAKAALARQMMHGSSMVETQSRKRLADQMGAAVTKSENELLNGIGVMTSPFVTAEAASAQYSVVLDQNSASLGAEKVAEFQAKFNTKAVENQFNVLNENDPESAIEYVKGNELALESIGAEKRAELVSKSERRIKELAGEQRQTVEVAGEAQITALVNSGAATSDEITSMTFQYADAISTLEEIANPDGYKTRDEWAFTLLKDHLNAAAANDETRLVKNIASAMPKTPEAKAAIAAAQDKLTTVSANVRALIGMVGAEPGDSPRPLNMPTNEELNKAYNATGRDVAAFMRGTGYIPPQVRSDIIARTNVGTMDTQRDVPAVASQLKQMWDTDSNRTRRFAAQLSKESGSASDLSYMLMRFSGNEADPKYLQSIITGPQAVSQYTRAAEQKISPITIIQQALGTGAFPPVDVQNDATLRFQYEHMVAQTRMPNAEPDGLKEAATTATAQWLQQSWATMNDQWYDLDKRGLGIFQGPIDRLREMMGQPRPDMAIEQDGKTIIPAFDPQTAEPTSFLQVDEEARTTVPITVDDPGFTSLYEQYRDTVSPADLHEFAPLRHKPEYGTSLADFDTRSGGNMGQNILNAAKRIMGRPVRSQKDKDQLEFTANQLATDFLGWPAVDSNGPK